MKHDAHGGRVARAIRSITGGVPLLAGALLIAGASLADAQRTALPGAGSGGEIGDHPYIPPPGQMDDPASFERPLSWHSGLHDGVGARRDGEPALDLVEDELALASQTMFAEDGAPWLRLRFGRTHLGAASFLRLRSLTVDVTQDLDARALENWSGYSAFLEGDALLLELWVAPQDRGVFVEVDAMLAGNPWHRSTWQAPDTGEDTLCGADNRVASGELRVGRVRRTDGFVFCSPWLASNGAVVMAGHCFDNDNNGTNELVTAGSIVEFNPPASSSSGTPNPSTPANQYPIDMTTLDWCPSPFAIGSDWGMMGLLPNATNDDRAHVTRGFYRMTRETPSGGTTMRLTGCGDDSTPAGSTGGLNAQSRTLQTSTGPFVAEYSSGARFWHRYAVDSENSSSGGPILWNTWGISIGIHTNAGCTSTGGSNQGISFEHTALETALRDFVATNAIFVDAGMPALGPAENGTVFRPYDTLQEGVSAVASGGVLSLVEGTYHPASGGTYTISKAMTIEAPVGTVTLTD